MPGYGWCPQTPDHRDLVFNLDERILKAHQLPKTIAPLTTPIAAYNQGELGSCTGNGVARVLEYQEYKQGEGSATPSRLFIYYNERVIEGTVSQDAGAQIRDGIKVIASQGAPPETLWPYSDQNPGPFQQKPPASVYETAKEHEAIRYQAVTFGAGAPFRTAIASGLPVVFGFSVPASFEDGSWDPATQVLPLPGPDEQFIGGHCVVADGYDFSCRDFPGPFWWCANSWGADWGDNGWFRMSHSYFTALASDFWVISKVE